MCAHLCGEHGLSSVVPVSLGHIWASALLAQLGPGRFGCGAEAGVAAFQGREGG